MKPHQLHLLRSISRLGSVPVSEIDGRGLRPLIRLGLVVEVHGTVQPTPAGRAIAEGEPSPPSERRSQQPPTIGRLSESQEKVLRYVLRQTGPVPADHVDGRVFRALLNRGLVEESKGWLSATDAAAPYLQDHTRRDRRRSLRRAAGSPRSARSEAILRATDMLELALPKGAELTIGVLPAYGDDVVAGLRKLAREME
jgi:hypothetical protein